MPSSSWFIMWQWWTKRPVKSRKRERKVTLPFRGTTTVSRQSRSASFSPLMAIIWNGLFGSFAPLDVRDLMRAHLDLIFGERSAP